MEAEARTSDGTSYELSRHARAVADHYDGGGYYLSGWHPRHLHFGIFEPDEQPFGPEGANAGQLDRNLLDRAVVRMIEEVVGPARIGAGDVVVDVACGVGGTALHLAGTIGCRVIGLNISERQMEFARELAERDGLTHRVEFRFSDCSEAIRMPDGSADAVMCIESACHMADRGRFLKECARVLKPGGRLAVQDWMASPALSSEDYREHIQPVCDVWAMTGLEDAAGYVEKLQAARLEIVEFEDLSARCLPNARILAAQEKRMRKRARNGTLPTDKLEWMERFRLLTRAWDAGTFSIRRFLARKPGMPGGHAGRRSRNDDDKTTDR